MLRASSIVQTMLANPQLDARRGIAQGVIDPQPRFANDTPEHRQTNRRIDITLSQGKAVEKSLQLLKP